MSPEFADGLFEAQRALWRSAAESFRAAAARQPDHVEAVFAAAVCELRCGNPQGAMLLLETAKAFARPHPLHTHRRAWLIVAARLQMGDSHGAQRATEALTTAQREQAMVFIEFAQTRYQSAIARLLRRARPASSRR